MFSDKEIKEIHELLKTNKKIVILAHHNPDGDAIGSSLGLHNFLLNCGIESNIIVPNDFPKFLKWMPNAKSIIIAEYKKQLAYQLIKNAEIIFCLDFNDANRIDHLQTHLEDSKAIKILIDHHQQPQAFNYIYSDTSEPATCQMVYKFIDKLNLEFNIDKNVAQCLYSGILTDTGSFRFRNTTSETHKIIANLIEKGAEPDLISSNILDSNSPERIKLLGVLLEKMIIIPENKTTILYLNREELTKNGYQKGDTEGFVNYGLSIMGIRFSALILDDLQNDHRRLSFRSKGDFDVNTFMRQNFQGGGHFNASGGKSYDSIEVIIEKIKKLIQNEKELQ